MMLVHPKIRSLAMPPIMLTPVDTEYVYDHLDCNSLSFVLKDGYFSIHRSIVIDAEDDPIFALPYFMFSSPEWGDEGNYNAITELHISPHQLNFTFAQAIAAEQTQVYIHSTQPVDLKLVDFLVNDLFLGDVVVYAEEMPTELRIKQVLFQVPLD